MEKAQGVLMGEGSFGWSDVGAWSSLASFWEEDDKGNAIRGDSLILDAQNNLIYNPDKLTALVGVKDLIVVETEDALLICPKDQDQKSKRSSPNSNINKRKNTFRPFLTGGELYSGLSKHRFDQYVCTDDNKQDGQNRDIGTVNLTNSNGQCDQAHDQPENIDPDAVHGADAHEAKNDQSGSDKPGPLGNGPLRNQPDASDHDQKQAPANGIQAFIEFLLFCIARISRFIVLFLSLFLSRQDSVFPRIIRFFITQSWGQNKPMGCMNPPGVFDIRERLCYKHCNYLQGQTTQPSNRYAH